MNVGRGRNKIAGYWQMAADVSGTFPLGDFSGLQNASKSETRRYHWYVLAEEAEAVPGPHRVLSLAVLPRKKRAWISHSHPKSHSSSAQPLIHRPTPQKQNPEFFPCPFTGARSGPLSPQGFDTQQVSPDSQRSARSWGRGACRSDSGIQRSMPVAVEAGTGSLDIRIHPQQSKQVGLGNSIVAQGSLTPPHIRNPSSHHLPRTKQTTLHDTHSLPQRQPSGLWEYPQAV